MINGLYSATSGMFNQIQRSDTIANNIANMETAGFKVIKNTFAQRLSQALYRDSALEPSGPPLVSLQGGGSYIANVYNSFSQGPLRQTGSDFDVALSGKGFLVVDTPSGRMYTRNGNFHPNERREMVTAEGYRVLGTDGTVTLPEGFF
ncbi:MAG TPA: flagellar hook-basal body complex protein, partial [bacterium]|nr:flagellar hook-basal body complex protein [bacterium]